MKATRKDASKLFHEGTVALAKMEANGIRIDVPYLDKAIKDTGEKIRVNEIKIKEDKLYKKWSRRFGSKTNIDSVQQLGMMLESEGYKSTEKTEKGNNKWDKITLSHFDLPFLKLYNETKELKKALTTYLIGIRREVTSDGFLHPSFNLAGGLDDDQKGGAGSYRGSSSQPNFQNIPIRNKLMQQIIRSAIIPRKGCDGFEIDFSQIEVRIAACNNHDPVLINYINDPTTDMHRDTAKELFLLSESQVGRKTTRDAAKNIFVFPQFYGAYYVECAKGLWEAMVTRKFTIEGTDKLVIDHLKEKGITKLGKCDPAQPAKKGTFEYHVQQVEKSFWEDRFTVYTQWKKETYWEYLKNGFIDMLTGFRCSGNYRRNQVLNLPIQGPAFHCLLWSIIEIQKRLEKYKMKTKLTAQIHDCKLGDSPYKEQQDYLDISKEVMTEKIRKHWDWIIVPLETEVDIFTKEKTWFGKSPYVKKNGIWQNAA